MIALSWFADMRNAAVEASLGFLALCVVAAIVVGGSRWIERRHG